ncbi:MAG: glycosyltransferase [Prolixibacteraceae bacterium]|nr:glycosyltransferase [Prolixibacteraceae bacterium]
MLSNKTIAVVIPAYNEEYQIGDVIKHLPDFVDHVVVVDDGSVDRTAEIAANHGANVVSHKNNRGVGAAFQTGFNSVLKMNVDIMVNIDADGQFDPNDIEKIISPILNEEADFVTASRFKDKSVYPKMSPVKFYGNRFMSWFISKLTRQKFYDVSCGFRAYSKETLLQLNLFGDFTYTQETFIDLAFKDLAIKEVSVHVKGKREHGKSRVASNIFRYAFQTTKIIIKTYRDYKPFYLFAWMGMIIFLIGLVFGLFLLHHYILTDSFSPHKWAGFVSGFFVIISLIFILIGFILDMFSRMRQNQEKILFELKKQSNNNMKVS